METQREHMSLRELWGVIFRGKRVIAAVALTVSGVSLAYALLATEWFSAEVVLAPSDDTSMSSLTGQLGGLASLAGITAGGDGRAAEAVATLTSRELASDFIKELSLTELLLGDQWDPGRKRWRNEDPKEWPDIRDAVRYFHKKVLSVREDRQTMLVTLTVAWTDPAQAALWANELVRRVNAKSRARALVRSEANVAFLRAELAKTNVVTLQQPIANLLEAELQRLMLARGNEEFAFRVIDRAAVPDEPSWPERSLIMFLGFVMGTALGVTWVLLVHSLTIGELKSPRVATPTT